MLVTQRSQAHEPTSEHIIRAVNTNLQGTDEEQHEVNWECDSNCRLNKLPWTTYSRGHKRIFVCDDSDCGHGSKPPGYSGTWNYLGHRDWYSTTWVCPDGHAINPPRIDRWGALSKNNNPPAPGMPAQRPHCATLSVSDASASEGSPLLFTVTLSEPHMAGTISWSTSAGEGANKAIFGGSDLTADSGTISVSGKKTFEVKINGSSEL